MLHLQNLIKEYRLDILVETGTEGGGGVAIALNAGFNKVYSCELNVSWAAKAQQRFKDNKNVILKFGPSIEFLKQLYLSKEIASKRKLFWLDAHLPKIEIADRTIVFPLKEELLFLKDQNTRNDVIAIDDVRLFEPNLRPDNWKEIIARYTKVGIREDLNIENIKSYFPNHNANLDTRKEGILVLTPK